MAVTKSDTWMNMMGLVGTDPERAHYLYLYENYRVVGNHHVRKDRHDDIAWIDARRYDVIVRLRKWWNEVYPPWVKDCVTTVPGGRFYGVKPPSDRRTATLFEITKERGHWSVTSSMWYDLTKGVYKVLCAEPTEWPVFAGDTDPAHAEEKETAIRLLDGTKQGYVHRQDLVDRLWEMDRRRSKYRKEIDLCTEIIRKKAANLLGYDRDTRDIAWGEVNGRRYLFSRERGDWNVLLAPEDAITSVRLDVPE